MKFAWNLDLEKHLLELVLSARGGGAAGKSTKKKTWKSIDDAMTARFKCDVQGKCQSKYQRLMAQYKTYQFVSGLRGVGIEPGTNKVSLDPSVWEDLAKSVDGNTQATSRMLQCFGFPHVDVCALIAGDSVATGEGGGSLADFVATTAKQAAGATPGSTIPSHPSGDSSND
ncbi:uncharacterized protein IUM83_13068 [Phytophthora cinnamomi]|uniref:uncharacterized protein n=1 Tax=Phytophthora cinnamomi TaxID=4785 RepID=UPI00355ABEC5|nr:hypothetical protein IUM83_13068 [Phytophthora cinnamomi]